jgi:GAF domain/Sel1 repeat
VQREVESLGTDIEAALNLIATRARTLLRASGAAIALPGESPSVMICRASAGSDAPPVGAPLRVGSGFSGECVLTGRLLLCADTESDARVDRENCRALGIRSILAAPVLLVGKVIGILEIFSGAPNCFKEKDSVVGQRLAETVLAVVNRAEPKPSSAASVATAGQASAVPESVPFSASVQEKGKEREKETVAEKIEHGISLPRTHLIVLICAAATIPLALGYILSPMIQSKIHGHGRAQVQTVLASSGSVNSPRAVSSEATHVAGLEELKRLAEQGDIPAQNALGRRYAQGEGVALDEAEAVRWFTKAAEQGSVVAQSRLGALYWRGRGLPQDVNKAYFWSVLARAGGDESGKALAMVLASHMTRAQSTAIEQGAENWFRQHQSAAKPSAGR